MADNKLLVFQDGLFAKLMTALGLGGCTNLQVERRTVFLVALIWLPPVVSAGIIGFLFYERPAVSIFGDLPFHIRCLVAIPILVALECRIQREFRKVLPTVVSRGMIQPNKTQKLKKIVNQTLALQVSMPVDILLLLLSFAMVLGRLYIDLSEQTPTWRTAESLPYVFAQMWNRWIGMTLYFFFAFRWICRFTAWAYFLIRISLLNPDLTSLHPDKVGGLGFLLRYHKMFGIAALAMSSVAASNIANSVIYENAAVDSFINPVLLYLLIFNFAWGIPLFFFTPSLIKARNQGLIRYAKMGNRYASDFDHKWLTGGSQFTLSAIGSPDIQSLNDLHGSYKSLAQMRISLLDTRTFLVQTAMIAIPLLPLLLFKFPIMELVMVIIRYFFKF